MVADYSVAISSKVIKSSACQRSVPYLVLSVRRSGGEREMRRRRVYLVLGIGLLFAAGLTVAVVRTPWFQNWHNPPALALPADNEVAEVCASLRKFQVAFSAVPEFIVPAEHVPVILSWLRPAEFRGERWNPLAVDELGEVVIRTRDGREIRLEFYWTGKNGVMFTPDGKDQFFGRGIDHAGRYVDGGMCLRNAIEEAFKASRR
jgi:hypothetical protein